MSGAEFRAARSKRGWTQAKAGIRLGISQTYVSLIEREQRPVPARLLRRVQRVFGLPATALPLGQPPSGDPANIARAVASLGYPGFAYLHPRGRFNPAQVLMAALGARDLEARVVEALPWIALEFPGLDWDWLMAQVRLQDLQNRLGYVVSQARRLAAQQDDRPAASKLAEVEERLERSRLVREDTLCRESLTQAERRWLASHRPAEAKRWNLLTDVVPEALKHAAGPS
jgi:transcriptional regulator with XRE-family HTH domain